MAALCADLWRGGNGRDKNSRKQLMRVAVTRYGGEEGEFGVNNS